MQWTQLAPQYDEWSGSFARRWDDDNGVAVTVDQVDVTELGGHIAEVLALGPGNDLNEHVPPAARFELDLFDLTGLDQASQRRLGPQEPLYANSSFDSNTWPNTRQYYGFGHGWVSDPGNYRKSRWASVGLPEGPASWEELPKRGTNIEDELTIQRGIGLAREIESHLAARASYIFNSFSAYRGAQQALPEVADDVYFTPARSGPGDAGMARAPGFNGYVVPQFSPNIDPAPQFLPDFIENYRQAAQNSQLYNFPLFPIQSPS